jgi:hypothetical protein
MQGIAWKGDIGITSIIPIIAQIPNPINILFI